MKLLPILTAAVLLQAAVIVHEYRHIMRQVEAHYTVAEVATERDRAALRYHGILVARCVDGHCTFERDGQVCQVFTNGFLERWYGKAQVSAVVSPREEP